MNLIPGYQTDKQTKINQAAHTLTFSMLHAFQDPKIQKLMEVAIN